MPAGSGNPALWGLICATIAFLIWGLSPIYFKALSHVAPFEILMHRMVWSFLFLLALVLKLGRWRTLIEVLKNHKTLGLLVVTTLLVGTNWFIFIWSISNNHILQASLGYYINPLVNVLLAMVFLGERLRRLQGASVVLATAGVIYLTLTLGEFPWVSLTLAFTFAFYGLIRKVAPVSALEGLSIETLLLFAPATGCLIYLDHMGLGAALRINRQTDLLLMASALVTAVPLLLFTVGARKLTFVTIGFLQYIAPSATFLLAVFVYREPFSTAQAITFIMIWSALALFSIDAIRTYRKSVTSNDANTGGLQ
ncbi:MAG: EamA family transporter RarD [Desulfobacteraceae bacterium]